MSTDTSTDTTAQAATDAEPLDVVIVGAGFTGPSAALELALQGRRVRVIEREEKTGGLAASFDIGDGKRLERFYHHWFSSDEEMIRLCEGLGISHPLEAHETRTGIYYANSVYRLSAPLDVLRFAPLPFYYIKGGSEALLSALQRRLESLGVSTSCSRSVSATARPPC